MGWAWGSRRAGGRRRPLAAAAVVLSLLLAACASGEDAPGQESPASAARGSASPGADGDGGAAPAARRRADRRPNLLLIEADDMRADELRWMPRTRRLIARTGLRFENSFAPNPVCCPSRASLLTGQYSHNHGVISHEAPYGFGAFDDSDTLATRLQDGGYRTALIGKYLNGYGRQPTYETGEDSALYVPPGWTDWRGASDPVRGPDGEYRGGTYAYFHLTSNVNGELQSWPGEYSTDVMGRQAREVLGDFTDGRRTDGRPWFVWWTPVAPHHGGPKEDDDPGVTPRVNGFPQGWLTPARPDEVKGVLDDRIERGLGVPEGGLPASESEDKPRYLSRLPVMTGGERRALRELSRQRAEALWALDGQVARTLRALRESGQARNTIVVFTSDNGYYLGEHLRRQGKVFLHEPSLRVPLLISGPGIPRGRRYDPATTIDLSRTLAAWAGVELAEPDGVDLAGTIDSGDEGWTRPVVVESLMSQRGYRAARERPGWDFDVTSDGVRVGGWKYLQFATGESELYDLDRDPLERESLPGPAGGMRKLLASVEERYERCAGQECRAPLPPELALGPERNRALTRRQLERTREFYG